MTAVNESGLVIPVQGSHVTTALAAARIEQDGFRKAEMSWLEEHNPLLWLQTGQLFEKVIQADGLTEAEASVAGRLLGNRSVRLCVNDSQEAYKQASTNYQRNRELYNLRSEQPGAKPPREWNIENILIELFEDEKLAAALMQIKHDRSRHSAAVAIGYFCFSKLPEVL